MPFYRFFLGWEGSPTKIDYRKKGTLILTSLLEDLGKFLFQEARPWLWTNGCGSKKWYRNGPKR